MRLLNLVRRSCCVERMFPEAALRFQHQGMMSFVDLASVPTDPDMTSLTGSILSRSALTPPIKAC